MKPRSNAEQLVSVRRRVFSLPTLLSFTVAIAFIYFLATRFDLDWAKTWQTVRSMNVWYYLLGLLLYYLSFGFRGARWRALAANAGIRDQPNGRLPSVQVFSQLIIIGWFVNAVGWLRMGDAYRAYALSQESGGGFSWSLGTVLAERVLDMATVFLLMVGGVAWYSLGRESDGTGRILLAALVMVVALGALLAVMRGYGTRLARYLPDRLEKAYRQFHQGALSSLRRLPLVLALSLAGWFLETGRLYFVVHALDIEVGLPLILIVTLGHALLSTVPTPGGIGAVEPGVTGLLMLSVARHDAVSVALVDRSITYVSIIAVGGIAFLIWQATRARRRRAETDPPEGVPGGGRLADL